MLCPFCEEQELQYFGCLYLCHKCRVALADVELTDVIRIKEEVNNELET